MVSRKPWVAGVLILAFIGVRSRAQQPAAPAQFAKGDVFVAVGNGRVQWRLPDGTLRRTLETGANNENAPTGMTFARNGDLNLTTFDNRQVLALGPGGEARGSFGGGYNCNPESIVFDLRGNAYVGQANTPGEDCSPNILGFDPSGNLRRSFTAAKEARGSDWIDLAADQCTLFYTSEGKSVKRFNACAARQLPDFATGLPGNRAYALRILPGGGLVVADSEVIVRLDAAGKIVKTYRVAGEDYWFALNLDPDGRSFWSADQSTSNVYKFDLATGQQLLKFSAGPGTKVGGLAVKGEITAGGGAAAAPPRSRGWIEVLMDTTTLVAAFGFLAFLVERLTNGAAIVLGYWGWWRGRMEISAAADPDTRARVERNRRVSLFGLSALLAVIGALLMKLNLLPALGFAGVGETAGEITTGLLIASGADPIREVLKLRERGRETPPPAPAPIHVTATVLLQQPPSSKKEGE